MDKYKLIKILTELKDALTEDPKSTRTEKARKAVGSAMDSEVRNFLFEVVYRSCGKKTKQCIDELQYFPNGYPALWDSFSQEQVIDDITNANLTPPKPTHPITIAVAVKNFNVSRVHILREIKEGRLKTYRPKNAPSNSPHIIDAKAVAERWTQRK